MNNRPHNFPSKPALIGGEMPEDRAQLMHLLC